MKLNFLHQREFFITSSRRCFREILFILAPLILSQLLFSLVRHLPLMPHALVIGSTGCLMLVLMLIGRADYRYLIIVRSALVGLLYLFWLKNSFFSFEGMQWDNRYFHLAIERFYYGLFPCAFEYSNIHCSFPPLYFLLIGKTGALLKTGIPTLVKYAGYLFAIYLPYIWGYSLKGIMKKKNWFAAFVLSLLVPFKLYESWYGALGTYTQKGWHFIGIFLMIIWYFWVREKKPGFFKAGILLGLILATDYFPVFLLIILVLIETLNTHRSGEAGNGSPGFFFYCKTAAVTLAVNLIWLVPVFFDMITHEWGTSFNQWYHYSAASFLNVCPVMTNLDIISLVLLGGMINIFLNYSGFAQAKCIRLLFTGLVVLALLIYILNLFGISFLLNDFSLLLLYLLALSAILFLSRLNPGILIPLLILLVINSTHILNEPGQNRELAEKGAQSARVYAQGKTIRQRYNLFGKTVFPYNNELFLGKNTFSFISPMAIFSDLSAEYENRLAFLNELAELVKKDDRSTFCGRLKNNPFSKVDFLYFRKAKPRMLTFKLRYHTNDLKKCTSARDLCYSFPRSFFSRQYFRPILETAEHLVFKIR